MDVVEVERRGNIALVHISNPPVNALSHAVRRGLMGAIEATERDEKIAAVVLICQGRTFFAGADIREFGKPIKSPDLGEVILALEATDKPWIAAIHGTALGGGLEVALGCRYRIALASARLGLPEVTLGLIPGAGGTVRLPRLIRVVDAVKIVTSGRPVETAKAHQLGLVDMVLDEVVEEGALENAALKYAKGLIEAKTPLPSPLSHRTPVEPLSPGEWQKLRDDIRAKARGQNSPVEAALAIEEACELSGTEALEMERQRFMRLKDSTQSKALRYAFFSERQTAKIERLKDVKALPVESCGVIGGGTMGIGIAAAMVLAKKSVTLIEQDNVGLDKALAGIKTILKNALARNLIDNTAHDEMVKNLRGSTGLAELSKCQLIVEAVFEDMAVKKKLFAELDAITEPQTLLASNTSYLDINEIAGATRHKERVVGLHFFSPAHIMKLVEVIAPDDVSNQTLATSMGFVKSLGKIGVLSGVCEGFIGNRIMSAYRRQCDFMLEEGCLPHQIDSAMKDFGLPMGIYEMADMAGLDIAWATRKRLAKSRDPRERYVAIADRLCELGRFGQKTGSGWYQYKQGSRAAHPDPLVEKIIEDEAKKNGFVRREFSDEEIITRILSAMTDEAKSLLDEGIAQRASDIDMVMILGFGFPRWRGGPMFMAENIEENSL